jgi:hypothetical protein
MGHSLEGLAISYDSGDQVTLEDVDSYLEGYVSEEEDELDYDLKEAHEILDEKCEKFDAEYEGR